MKHTLKLIYRNFRKNLSINLINLGGLSLSMAVVLMLAAYCYSELTTDWHHENVDQIFMVGKHTPAILAEHLQNEIPEIKKVVRLADTWENPILKTENGSIFQTELIYADDGFFDLFNYNILKGNISEALSEPMSIVLTKSEAMRIFGNTDVIGQSITINNEHLVKITAVIDPPRHNSSFTIKTIVPISIRPIIQPNGNEFTNWKWSNFETFIRVNESANMDKLESSIENIFAVNSHKWEIKLLPLKEIYFLKDHISSINYMKAGDLTKIRVLITVAFLMLTIALINYVNISSFSLRERLPQLGIFKIIGANRKQLLQNMLFESFLFFFISIWIAIMLSEIIQPVMFKFSGVSYSSGLLLSPWFIFISVTIAIILGFITSFLPSIKHSKSDPVKNLKKEFTSRNKASILKGCLVTFQFSIAIVLIIFTILIQKQIQFGTSDLGLNDENILTIKRTPQLETKLLHDKLLSHPNIKNISFTQYYPGKRISQWTVQKTINGKEMELSFNIFDADDTFFDIMGIKLLSGRFYSDTITSDKNKILVNSSFVKEHSIENPLDFIIPGMNGPMEVVGVVEDFHFLSKNHAITPLVMQNTGGSFYCLVELSHGDFSSLHNSIEEIKKVTAELSPDFPVGISFMDTAIEQMYQSEIQFRHIFTFFAGCTIFVSCLGILALSLFTSQQRTKEIGIRKVNGAHFEDILYLLNRDFVRYVGIAFIISLPIAWIIINKWLENFAYKTEISWWIFLLGGAAALMIALLTVSWQSWNAARRNPVEALRYE